jgi:hypothetical protein
VSWSSVARPTSNVWMASTVSRPSHILRLEPAGKTAGSGLPHL